MPDVFISYSHDDKDGVDRLLASLQTGVNLAILNEITPDVRQNLAFYRLQIRELLQQSSAVICFVGTNTATNKWVEWELRTARELGRPIIGVYLDDRNKPALPNPIIDAGAPVYDALGRAVAELVV